MRAWLLQGARALLPDTIRQFHRGLLAKVREMIERSITEGFLEPVKVMVVLAPRAGSV